MGECLHDALGHAGELEPAGFRMGWTELDTQTPESLAETGLIITSDLVHASMQRSSIETAYMAIIGDSDVQSHDVRMELWIARHRDLDVFADVVSAIEDAQGRASGVVLE